MSYPLIAARVYNTLWAMRPQDLGSLLTVLHSRLAGDRAAPELLATYSAAAAARRLAVKHYTAPGLALEDVAITVTTPKPSPAAAEAPAPVPAPTALTAQPASTVAVIYGSGILGKHLSSMEEDCAGGLSVDRLTEALTKAAADPSVSAIVLWLNTPGGVVTGIPETADLVARIRQTKTIVAYCDSLCASAGYWIASACDAIYCTRSADLGSIGVYSALLDISALYAAEGVKVELFKDGIYKAAGFPGTTLTDAQREDIQKGVDDISRAFKADVTKYRPGVTAATMQGQCFTGAAAVEAHLADDLVSTLDDVLADLATL